MRILSARVVVLYTLIKPQTSLEINYGPVADITHIYSPCIGCLIIEFVGREMLSLNERLKGDLRILI